MLPNQSRLIEMDGGQVQYLIEGNETGRPVVLLHGASFRAETWKQLGTMTVLAQAGFLAYAVNLPGFGQSSPGGGPARTWLRRLFDALKIDAPVVVSPSMSGQYALPLVIEEPQRVAGFVAVAPVGIMNYHRELAQIQAPVLAIWGEHDRTVPLDHAYTLVQAVKRGRKVIIAGGSHAPYMSDPAAFHKELLKFLSELS
jgi:pimeloyl-ACP methyl ester carboxylesterase